MGEYFLPYGREKTVANGSGSKERLKVEFDERLFRPAKDPTPLGRSTTSSTGKTDDKVIGLASQPVGFEPIRLCDWSPIKPDEDKIDLGFRPKKGIEAIQFVNGKVCFC